MLSTMHFTHDPAGVLEDWRRSDPGLTQWRRYPLDCSADPHQRRWGYFQHGGDVEWIFNADLLSFLADISTCLSNARLWEVNDQEHQGQCWHYNAPETHFWGGVMDRRTKGPMDRRIYSLSINNYGLYNPTSSYDDRSSWWSSVIYWYSWIPQ